MIEPRDRDGFLAKDRPEDHFSAEELATLHGYLNDKDRAAYEAALQDALNERDSLAYQSVGLLRAMLASGAVPEGYLTGIKQLDREYEAINDKLVAILADKKS